jgi:hypothetical protein
MRFVSIQLFLAAASVAGLVACTHAISRPLAFSEEFDSRYCDMNNACRDEAGLEMSDCTDDYAVPQCEPGESKYDGGAAKRCLTELKGSMCDESGALTIPAVCEDVCIAPDDR